jgi:hypothetical protein
MRAIAIDSPGTFLPWWLQRKEPMRSSLAAVGAALITAIVGVLLLAAPTPAAAASYGPGFDVGQGRIGAYLTPLGTQAYCLEIAKDRPLGPTDAGSVGGWGGLGPADLARLNYVINRFGQSPDPLVTAAVNLYVWSIADPGQYGSHGMSGDDYYSARAGDAASTVRATLAAIRADAALVVPAGSAAVSIELDDSTAGRVVVSSDPAGASGTLTVDGAVIAGTGGSSAQVTGGSVVDIVGIPAEDAASYSISAHVEFGSVPPSITVHDSGAAQHLAGPGPLQFAADARVDVPLDFAPTLTTAVAAPRISVGDRPVDRLTVALAPDSPAPWRLRPDGTFVPVIATGVLYGPLATPPTEGTPDLPAPVAWTEQVTLTGPGEVSSSGNFVVERLGFYTWVWSITADGQPEAVLPTGYAWSDMFGLAAETFEVVQPLALTGSASSAAVPLAGSMLVLLGTALVLRRRAGQPRVAPRSLQELQRP